MERSHHRADPRAELLGELFALDDEAFTWLLLALAPSAMLHGGHTQVWPDGLGGFRDRERIERIRKLAGQLIDAQK